MDGMYSDLPIVGRKARQPATLKREAEKILVRQLRKTGDPRLAREVLGIHPEGLHDQLRELKAAQVALEEIVGKKSEGMTDGFWGFLGKLIESPIAKGLASQAITYTLAPRAQEAQPPQLPEPEPQPALPPAPAPQPPPAPERPKGGIRKEDIENILEMEPTEAIDHLVRVNPQAIGILGGLTFEGLAKSLSDLRASSSEFKPLIDRVLSEEKREWLIELLNLCKKLIQEGLKAEKK